MSIYLVKYMELKSYTQVYPTSSFHLSLSTGCLFANQHIMSAFGAKRKARKINVQEDDDNDSPLGLGLDTPIEPQQEPALQATFKTRRPLKQSSLRKSINVNDGDDDDDANGGAPVRVVRPQQTKSVAAAKTKKRASVASRLSFGPSEAGYGGHGGENDGNGNGDGDSLMLGGEVSTPRKAAAVRSTYKKPKGVARNLPGLGGLPLRSTDAELRSYSKEHLSELQSSTPNTPPPPRDRPVTAAADGDEEMSLDPSELEGAMIVDDADSSSAAPPPPPHQTEILTEAQIREKKERRARLAKQAGSQADDYIALSDDEENNNSTNSQLIDNRRTGDSYLSVLSRKTRGGEAEGTRLVREDEDLGEGFDEFVEDGGLSLGRRAERDARRRQRAKMASLIDEAEGRGEGPAATTSTTTTHIDHDAEGLLSEESDASEAERRAAYEAAQTRRGMDGLAAEREALIKKKRQQNGVVPVPHRIAPLPDLGDLAAAFGAKLRARRDEAVRARAHVAALRAERDDLAAREPEVQRLLDQAGERYRRLVLGDGGGGGENPDGAGAANGDAAERAKSLLDQVRMGGSGSAPGTPTPLVMMDRGLESLGTTPVRVPRADDDDA